jgi:hypothetical protein
MKDSRPTLPVRAAQRRRALAALVLSCAAAAAAAEVYRWTDAAGVTHFGASPPPGVQAAKVTPPSSPPAADPAQANARLEAIRKDIEARAAARVQAEQDATQARQQTARMTQECDRARAELAAMESARRVNRPDGTTVYGDERLALMEELRRSIAEHCR